MMPDSSQLRSSQGGRKHLAYAVKYLKGETKMMKVRISHWKLIALGAVLGLVFIPGADAFRGDAPNAAGPDLSNEQRTIGSYAEELFAYNQAVGKLGKKASLVGSEVEPLERKSDALKSRLSNVQNAISDVVRKLKEADAWNDLDSTLLANVSNARVRTLFQESSFKSELEDAATSLNSRAGDISLPLAGLRKKVAQQGVDRDRSVLFVRAAYITPEPGKFVSLGCTLNRIDIKLIHKAGGIMSDHRLDVASCACSPGPGNTGLATGTPCDEVR
jgi:hypothetical protein